MKHLRKIIVFIILIIALLIIALLFLLNYQSNSNITLLDDTIISGDLYDYESNETITLTDKTSFYTVAQCVSEYLDKLDANNSSYYGTDENGEYTKIIDQATISQGILNYLDKTYIAQNHITKENVNQFVETVTEKEIFTPLKMNILPKNIIEKYAVYGFTESMEHNFVREIYIIVNLDVENYTYSIEPLLNQNYTNINEIKLTNDNIAIERNENNQFQYKKVNNEYISNQYLNSYKRMLLSNPQLAYQYLQDDYKNTRFQTYERFEDWIDFNKKRLSTISLEQYTVRIKDNYTQYTCVDQNGNYYIFQETAPMQYTLLLDTYTIDLPEFLEQYQQASSEKKVLMNIQKFFQAIDAKDYAYAYNKLDETYRANNFATQQEFATYVQNTFFESNKLAAGTAEKQGDIYLYSITVSDKSGVSSESITKTFVMQLKEGTDFVMSFSK